MNLVREFRQVTFDRKLEVKRLRAALSKTTREAMKSPSPEATPVRPESILIESDRTTIFLSGDSAGLDAVAAALGKTFPDAKVTKASREDAARPPRAMTRSTGQAPEGRRRR